MEEVIKNENKKNLGGKIASIAMLCVAGLLVVAMVLCYFLPKSFAPEIATPSYVKVYVKDKYDGLTYYSGSQEYNKIMELYNDSYKVTVMDALLTGNLSKSGELVSKTQSTPKSLEDVAVEFYFAEPQTIKVNGKDAQVSTNKYLTATLVVSNTSELTETKLYYLYYNTSSGSSKTYSYHNYTSYAHQSELYNYLANTL